MDSGEMRSSKVEDVTNAKTSGESARTEVERWGRVHESENMSGALIPSAVLRGEDETPKFSSASKNLGIHTTWGRHGAPCGNSVRDRGVHSEGAQ
jgi:hypothetical protein